MQEALLRSRGDLVKEANKEIGEYFGKGLGKNETDSSSVVISGDDNKT